MMTETELTIVRRAYAKQIMADLQVRDAAIEDAFAIVPRESFLGPGPWPIHRADRQDYAMTPDADPVYLYTNDLVGIDPARRLNNGQPSLHAYLMACAAPRPGEHVVHVGAGVGYYSAILARLVGASGRLTAIEYDHGLAARARANLAAQATVIPGDGSMVAFEPADIIYVNAGATRPANAWLDRLRPGGRLILPLTTRYGFGGAGPGDMARHGAVFLVTRDGEGFAARRVSRVGIYPCEGQREEASERALAAALARSDGSEVRRLVRHGDLPEEQCWLRGPDWCFTKHSASGEAGDAPADGRVTSPDGQPIHASHLELHN